MISLVVHVVLPSTSTLRVLWRLCLPPHMAISSLYDAYTLRRRDSSAVKFVRTRGEGGLASLATLPTLNLPSTYAWCTEQDIVSTSCVRKWNKRQIWLFGTSDSRAFPQKDLAVVILLLRYYY